MSRPHDMPGPERFPHGTRARYTSGCRCGKCRGANRKAYHERQRRAKELAAQIMTPAAPSPQKWTTPSGEQKVRIYKRACPGVGGRPCATSSHLRKDSKGGVCGKCRLKLDWNGLVDAARARRHLRRLSRLGVGRRSVRAACDVGDTTLQRIITGQKQRIRARTERRILEVDAEAVADHGLVDAAETWRLVEELLRHDFTEAGLARLLGSKAKYPSLQLGRRKVTAKNAQKVRRLHRRYLVESGSDEWSLRRRL